MKNSNNSKKFIIFIFLILTSAFLFLILRQSSTEETASALDDFAKCLAEKKIVMYGAYWCPHCQNEKAAFGDSFKYVNYVECTQEPQKCLEKGVKSYPTWILPGGGQLVGEQGVEKLAQASGCALLQKGRVNREQTK